MERFAGDPRSWRWFTVGGADGGAGVGEPNVVTIFDVADVAG